MIRYHGRILLKPERVTTRFLRQPLSILEIGCRETARGPSGLAEATPSPKKMVSLGQNASPSAAARERRHGALSALSLPRIKGAQASFRRGGRASPFDYSDREEINWNRLGLCFLEESLSYCKHVSGDPVSSTLTPVFRLGFTIGKGAEDARAGARAHAAQVKTPPCPRELLAL